MRGWGQREASGHRILAQLPTRACYSAGLLCVNRATEGWVGRAMQRRISCLTVHTCSRRRMLGVVLSPKKAVKAGKEIFFPSWLQSRPSDVIELNGEDRKPGDWFGRCRILSLRAIPVYRCLGRSHPRALTDCKRWSKSKRPIYQHVDSCFRRGLVTNSASFGDRRGTSDNEVEIAKTVRQKKGIGDINAASG